MKVIINGVGIAGPTLAWWLDRNGHEVVLVEQAPALRTGGYVIDFWGVGYDVAEQMGLIDRVREAGYRIEEVRLVDSTGHKVGGLDAGVFRRIAADRFTSVTRSALATILHDSLGDRVETRFGDSIAAIDDRGDAVGVEFDHGAAEEYDLVIGADGLHSRVRRLLFGADDGHEVSLHHHVAAFSVEGYQPRDELVYMSHGVPGRQVARFSMRDDRTLFLLIMHDDWLPGTPPADAPGRRGLLRQVFADVGWETPRILDTMDAATDFYFDGVTQIRLSKWSQGRTALIGDAAACVSFLAGEGTGLAMTEAYVLAGELGRAGTGAAPDPTAAFGRYHTQLAPFLAQKQASAGRFAKAFVAKSRLGLITRNVITHLMRIGFVAELAFGRDMKDDFELPSYE